MKIGTDVLLVSVPNVIVNFPMAKVKVQSQPAY